MKIILINSPLFKDKNELYDEDSLPPLGLGYIATHLENNGIEVELIDAVYHKVSLEDLISILNYYKPDYIATNIFTTNYMLVKEMVESLTFKASIIIGGLSTKDLFKQIFEWKTSNNIDIVIGDGELITLDIVNQQLRQQPFDSFSNRRAFKVDGSSIYFVKDISNIPLNRKFFLNEPAKHPLGFWEANIVTSRGCIYNCTFCAAARSLNKEYPIRDRTEESLIAELSEIQRTYPKTSSIRVLDDLFLKTRGDINKANAVFSNLNFNGELWLTFKHLVKLMKKNWLL